MSDYGRVPDPAYIEPPARERLKDVSEAMGRVVPADNGGQWMMGYIANWKRTIDELLAASAQVREGEPAVWKCGFCLREYTLDALCCQEQRDYRAAAEPLSNDELPGMRERADFMGGATDYDPAPEPVPVAQGDVIDPLWGAMREADFEASTITFDMRGDYYAAAGLYAIAPQELHERWQATIASLYATVADREARITVGCEMIAEKDATIADHARRVAELQAQHDRDCERMAEVTNRMAAEREALEAELSAKDEAYRLQFEACARLGDVEASLAACRAELDAWQPIMQEVERRADKEWCITDQCDFAVTVTYEDFARIEALRQEAPHAD